MKLNWFFPKRKIYLIMIILSLCIYESIQGGSCNVDDDCGALNYCENKECTHKGFFPITVREMIGLLIIFIASALANASGIGGGGLYVPILIVLNGFSLKDSTPISKFMIFCSALVAFIIGIAKKHNPEKGYGSSIDMNLVSYMVPFIVMGSQIGLVINITFPQLILIIIMTLVLIFSTIKTFMSAARIYKEETLKKEEDERRHQEEQEQEDRERELHPEDHNISEISDLQKENKKADNKSHHGDRKNSDLKKHYDLKSVGDKSFFNKSHLHEHRGYHPYGYKMTRLSESINKFLEEEERKETAQSKELNVTHPDNITEYRIIIEQNL